MVNFMYFFFYWLWFIMIIFVCFKHPLMMGLLLIVETFFLCCFTLIYSFSSWNSFILFLMFLGGILILFLYNISLIPMEMFSMKLNYFFLFFFFNFNFKESNLFDMLLFYCKKNNLPTLFFMLKHNYNSIMFLMMYLFFTLICITNLIYLNKDKGSMRSNIL